MTSDQAGRFAELIAMRDLSRPIGGRYRRPLFRATPLGEKYPTVDLLVDVLDPEDMSQGFFFAQVKGTQDPAGARLSVEVDRERFNRLVRIPAPTYLIGVDTITEVAYIVSADRTRAAMVSSIAKSYSLQDECTKINLYKEVLTFWRANRPILRQTRFHDV